MKRLLLLSILILPSISGSSPLSFYTWAEKQDVTVLTLARCSKQPDECIIKKYGKHYHIFAPFVLDGVSHYGKIHIYGTKKSSKPRSRSAKEA